MFENEKDVHQDNRLFSIPVHINYEDTDAGGVVYYGNYLGYMERARNAYLRQHGFPLSLLARDHKVLFVVTEANIKYLFPARLDDELQVTLKIEKMGAATILFLHEVLKEDKCLVQARVNLATINSETFKPCRIPQSVRSCFNMARFERI
jgi:acyl-CoA thioester hydrolase